MTAEVLGGAVDDQVGTEPDRGLIDGCRESVVDDQQGPRAVCRLGPVLDVVDPQKWIRRALQDRHTSSRADGALGLRGLLVAHPPNMDAEPRKECREQVERAPIE